MRCEKDFAVDFALGIHFPSFFKTLFPLLSCIQKESLVFFRMSVYNKYTVFAAEKAT